tara:strand:+ start:185 stop:526 length:342 start_codon:yes stop_codon:yes gene_type:complete
MSGSVILLISCNSADNSALENTVNELKENQNNIQEQIIAIKELQDNQKVVLKKMQSMEKTISNLALANKNKPADKSRPPQADPNKVYNIEIGDSFSIGPDNAKVTIIEWMDFQ